MPEFLEMHMFQSCNIYQCAFFQRFLAMFFFGGGSAIAPIPAEYDLKQRFGKVFFGASGVHHVALVSSCRAASVDCRQLEDTWTLEKKRREGSRSVEKNRGKGMVDLYMMKSYEWVIIRIYILDYIDTYFFYVFEMLLWPQGHFLLCVFPAIRSRIWGDLGEVARNHLELDICVLTTPDISRVDASGLQGFPRLGFDTPQPMFRWFLMLLVYYPGLFIYGYTCKPRTFNTNLGLNLYE